MKCGGQNSDTTPWRTLAGNLIRRTATELPDDITAALGRAAAAPAELPVACSILSTLLDNADLARNVPSPICQDTGSLTFWVETPTGADLALIASGIRAAVADCTRQGHLRRNTIATLSGRSLDDNLAPDTPAIHFEPLDEGDDVTLWLLLKGGGCENVSTQYSLPDTALGAGRDVEGARACILDAVWRAQGLGCAPGILGVCLGGDRAAGYLHAKRQLLRPLTDEAPEPELARLEARLLKDANTLGIGPMGMGGGTTLLGVKLAEHSRLPASYFVTVTYSCWACRRRGVMATAAGGLKGWLG